MGAAVAGVATVANTGVAVCGWRAAIVAEGGAGLFLTWVAGFGSPAKNRFDLFCTAAVWEIKLPKVCGDKYWIDLDRSQRQYLEPCLEHDRCVGIAESEKE